MNTELRWNDQGRVVTAQIANVSYYVDTGDGSNVALLVVRGWRGGKRRLILGNFNTLEDAKRKCEQHYADGCDVSAAKPYPADR